MKQKQLEKILETRIDIPGLAKDLLTTGFIITKKATKLQPGACFIDNKDGTITDIKTDLTWVKNPHTDLPEKFKNIMKWQDAIDSCKELNFVGHKDWRLPTVEELISIIDWEAGTKSDRTTINIKFFPDTKTSWYWTITPCPWDADYARIVNFYNGYVYDSDKDNYNYVRPVRSSQ
jgi:hypothetical protein